MAAKLHLAENSLALHLFLERLEGLINIVVANENLHVVSCVPRPSLDERQFASLSGESAKFAPASIREASVCPERRQLKKSQFPSAAKVT